MMKKILITDDREHVRELVEVTLSLGDYEIFQASSGESAIDLAESEQPDLVIMDVMMPGGMDGLEATRQIKKVAGCQKTKVIMLTAKGQLDDIRAGLEAGADDYLTKPFSPLELMNKVESTLG
jgi:DNA-binding response OmpR family regulator